MNSVYSVWVRAQTLGGNGLPKKLVMTVGEDFKGCSSTVQNLFHGYFILLYNIMETYIHVLYNSP